MLIILETSRKEQRIRQCYAMLVNVLTAEDLRNWGMPDVPVRIVANRMIDWGTSESGDFSDQIVQVRRVDNVGDQSSGGIASCGNPNDAAG